MLKGRFIQPSEFADKIIQGFESAYLGAMENTETLLRIIQQYGELEVRYLIRNTQQYAIVLSSSYHPELLKCYGTTKSIKEVELKNMKPEDNVTVSRYIERNVGSIINKDYVIEGFLGMGKLSDCKDEMVSRLDISKRYCLEILVAFLQEADIIILHEMFENVWNHTIEEILVEFSLRGAVVVFSEHGEESLMKLPMHSYDLSGRCVGW